jgi:hypothetical protein
MKTRKHSHLAICIVACLTLASLTACKTATYDRGDAAARSLQNAAAEVQIESRYLTFTMSALEDLVKKPAADLRPQFKQFSKNLDRLEACARRNEKAAESTYLKHAAYFRSWDRQITNMNYEVVRSRSETRRTEVTERFNAVNRRYYEARTTMQPVLAYLNDIRRALGSDLTPAGIEAAKPIVANAADNAKKVQVALAKLTDELSDSGARMASVGTPASGGTTNVAGH